MGLQEAEFDGDLWFFADSDSDKIRQIEAQPQVNVAFASQRSNAWVSISGTARQAYDRAKAEKLWNPFLKAWFPGGLDTPRDARGPSRRSGGPGHAGPPPGGRLQCAMAARPGPAMTPTV